jgi:hypothetical protein
MYLARTSMLDDQKYNGVNPVNGKSLFDLYQRTWDKIQYIKDQGYNVVEMWECQWLASIKRDPELSRFIKSRKRDGLVTMTEDQILTAVMDEKLFGALEVDIKVPGDLKSKFSEMAPIFKNIEVSRDDIGDHMKTYAEERNVMNQPRKCLVGSMFGYFTFAEVVCGTWLESDPDPSSGGVQACSLLPEIRRQHQ